MDDPQPANPDIPLFDTELGDRWEGVRPHLHKAYLEVIGELTTEDISNEEKGRNITAAHMVWNRITHKMAQWKSAPPQPKRQRLTRV